MKRFLVINGNQAILESDDFGGLIYRISQNHYFGLGWIIVDTAAPAAMNMTDGMWMPGTFDPETLRFAPS